MQFFFATPYTPVQPNHGFARPPGANPFAYPKPNWGTSGALDPTHGAGRFTELHPNVSSGYPGPLLDIIGPYTVAQGSWTSRIGANFRFSPAAAGDF